MSFGNSDWYERQTYLDLSPLMPSIDSYFVPRDNLKKTSTS